jgi:transcriptional regulator with XRE-family HTH domain
MGQSKSDFDLKGWFDKEVKELESDPEYIANGLMIELAAQVKRKLDKEGLKQTHLAKKLDKSDGWISRFMNDPTNFSIKKLTEIAVALDMELSVSFKEVSTVSITSPKTVTGRKLSGPNREFSFSETEKKPQEDASYRKVKSETSNHILAA